MKVERRGYRCLMFLTSLYIMALIGTQLLIHKFVYFAHLDISAAVLIFPLSFTLADIVTEVYGLRFSKQLIWSGLITVLIFCSFTIFLVNLPSPKHMHHQEIYNIIFDPLLRSYLACFCATIVGGFVNVYCLSKWQVLLRGRYFWLRSIGSTLIGECVFTMVADPIIFWGRLSIKEMFMIAISSYVVKIIYACVSSGPATVCVNIIRHLERDNLEQKFQLNPFAKGDAVSKEENRLCIS